MIQEVSPVWVRKLNEELSSWSREEFDNGVCANHDTDFDATEGFHLHQSQAFWRTTGGFSYYRLGEMSLELFISHKGLCGIPCNQYYITNLFCDH